MELLPQDIRQKVFSKKTIGGVSNEEVSTFLLDLSNEFEKLKHQNKSLNKQIVQLNNELARYRDIENKLFQALENGKEINERTKANAEQEAQLIVNRGKFQAEKLLKEARSKAQKILEKTEKYCKERIAATDQKVLIKKEEIERLEHGRQKVIAELNHFMNKTLDKIKKLADKSSFRFSSFHETEAGMVSPNIDWDYTKHFDHMVKGKPSDKQVLKPNTQTHQENKPITSVKSKTVNPESNISQSINERYKKPPSIHERFQNRRGLDEDE